MHSKPRSMYSQFITFAIKAIKRVFVTVMIDQNFHLDIFICVQKKKRVEFTSG